MPSIRVSGFTSPRARGPLVAPNGNLLVDVFFGSLNEAPLSAGE